MGYKVNDYDISPFANLRGAYLYNANLYGANLRGAYLECANLEGATFSSGWVITKEKL